MNHTTDRISAPGNNRTRITTVVAHLLAIGALFILPEMVSSLGRPVQLPWQLQLGSYLKAGVFIGIFYLNYLLIIPRAMQRGHSMMRPLLWNLLVIAVALFLLWASTSGRNPSGKKRFRAVAPNRPTLPSCCGI